MTKTKTPAPNRTRRGSILAVLFFAFVYIGQPALALVGSLSSSLPCKARGQQCCCVEQVEAPVRSCCSERKPVTDDHRSEGQCDCRAGVPEVPTQVPALPLQDKDLTGENELTNWVRTHAELFTSVASGPPVVPFSEQIGGGAGTGLLPLRSSASSFGSPLSSIGAWALLTRGVGGFLAVFSAARL